MKKSLLLGLGIAALALGGAAFGASAISDVAPVETSATDATTGKRYYLNLSNNTQWENDGVWFAVYLFSKDGEVTLGETWLTLERAGNSHYYYFDAPTGSWSQLIFVRMNSSKSELSWDSKCNQSGDLYFGSDDVWTMTYGAWDKDLGAWSSSIDGSTRIFSSISSPTNKSIRYWFYPDDTSKDSGHFFNSNARLGVYVTGTSNLSSFYLTTAYTDHTDGPVYYYVDVPSHATSFQFARVVNGSETGGKLTVWDWGKDTFSVSSYPASKFWYLYGQVSFSDGNFSWNVGANGSEISGEVRTTTISGYTMCNILSAYYTCSDSVNNGYGGCENLYNTVWSHRNDLNGSFTTTSNPGISDYSKAAYNENENKYDGLSRTESISATTKWEGLCEYAGIDPVDGTVRTAMRVVFAGHDQSTSAGLMAALAAGCAGVVALAVGYYSFKLKKNREE